mmetsp:Transcript_1070/g.3644  ORF Transcript_1070/g.3644 Transcript_1070/m.3644 type:complete len:375 (-) Transcript_1070:262-1386(-)
MVQLCASVAGFFAGLVADHVHEVVPSSLSGQPEMWVEVIASEQLPAKRIANSFAGVYLQVLPDDADSYNDVSTEGSFTQTYVSFDIRVEEEAEKEGIHTLFLRWSGGDVVGGGDSLYAVMVDKEEGSFVPGLATVRDATVAIEGTQYSGCCYDAAASHECACVSDLSVCSPPTVAVDRVSAQGFGAQCPAGRGQVDRVPAPLWYEFAGGNVLDFDAEPWDVKCEAQGTGPADSGRDAAQWDLTRGTYELRLYPREDGTAFDAFYLAGPSADAPRSDLRLSKGASTVCFGPPPPQEAPSQKKNDDDDESSSSGLVVGLIFGLIAVVLTAAAVVFRGRLLVTAAGPSLGLLTTDEASSYLEMEMIASKDDPNAAMM